MTVSRFGAQFRGQSFGRAKLSRRTLLFLIVLRCYAIVAVAIAVYSFFRAL